MVVTHSDILTYMYPILKVCCNMHMFQVNSLPLRLT